MPGGRAVNACPRPRLVVTRSGAGRPAIIRPRGPTSPWPRRGTRLPAEGNWGNTTPTTWGEGSWWRPNRGPRTGPDASAPLKPITTLVRTSSKEESAHGGRDAQEKRPSWQRERHTKRSQLAASAACEDKAEPAARGTRRAEQKQNPQRRHAQTRCRARSSRSRRTQLEEAELPARGTLQTTRARSSQQTLRRSRASSSRHTRHEQAEPTASATRLERVQQATPWNVRRRSRGRSARNSPQVERAAGAQQTMKTPSPPLAAPTSKAPSKRLAQHITKKPSPQLAPHAEGAAPATSAAHLEEAEPAVCDTCHQETEPAARAPQPSKPGPAARATHH